MLDARRWGLANETVGRVGPPAVQGATHARAADIKTEDMDQALTPPSPAAQALTPPPPPPCRC